MSSSRTVAVFVLLAASLCVRFAAAEPVATRPVDTVVAANYPPLMIEGSVERPGYAVDVLRIAAMRANRALEISFMPYERAMHAVRAGPAVLMPALFYGKRRNEGFQWIAQIQAARLRFARIGASVTDLDEARAFDNIVVERGTTADVFLTELGFKNLIHVATPKASALMLQHGRADAWLQDETIIRQTWAKEERPGPVVFGSLIHEVPIFLLGSPTLPPEVIQAYRNAIASMKADGTLVQLWTRYR
ncbi:MAG: transporter substrate-binding domain-containing protein [Pseudomonadota bacterium]